MQFNKNFIKSTIKNVEFLGEPITRDFFEFSVDSRELKSGQIFVALQGKNCNGHEFIGSAIKAGAVGLIINKEHKDLLNKFSKKDLSGVFIILVDNTYDALLDLAAAWRAQFKYPIIGITGSIGKTSTKEIISNILTVNNSEFVASYGNQNTPVGLSLNILRLRPDHAMGVFEMGASKRGEMALMASIAKPTTAVVTCIGHSHMEGLGSLVDIANEKRDIFKYFKEDNIGIINGDQAILSHIAYAHPIVKFGSKTTNQIQARKVQSSGSGTDFILKIYKQRYKVVLNTSNASRVTNVLAASAVAYLLDIPSDAIIKGVQKPLNIPSRFETKVLKSQRGIIIDDCYNANPESMKAALTAFEKVESKGQKIAVIGDMLELGVNSPFWHRQIGRFLRKVPSLNHVILVGNAVSWSKSTLPVTLSYEHVNTWKEAKQALKQRLDKEAVVLVKASQDMLLNNIVTELAE